MIAANECFLNMLNSPVRKLKARVELYQNGNTELIDTFYHTDRLKSLTIERVGEESKFFGYGICQKINIKLLDTNRQLNITTGHNFEVVFGTDCEFVYTCPIFYVSEVHRDENTNELSITAYDGLYKAVSHTVSELPALPQTFTLQDYATAIARFLGFPIAFVNVGDSFGLTFNSQANFEGTESLRYALNAIAEATQTVYYIDSEWRLTFRRLDKDGTAVYSITKDRYYTLNSGANRRLAAICSATELGDNLTANLTVSGTTQYVRDNPFWDLREDRAVLVDAALSAIGGISINQFELNWRGNFLLEIGDKIELTTKDGGTVSSYLLDDVISYDGSFVENTRWNYIDNEVETATNPTGLGDVINSTYARVDKANREIALVASETASNSDSISSILLNTESITTTVSRIETETNASIAAINGDITRLSNAVSASITADDVRLEITRGLESGVSKISTTTGYTFDDEGLTVSKTGSEMTTQITEDGMIVSKNDEAVLTANNVGVNAVNLHATTYLIIGTNSRLEDYGYDRTGCFWIGG